jgi:hypothetical protein
MRGPSTPVISCQRFSACRDGLSGRGDCGRNGPRYAVIGIVRDVVPFVFLLLVKLPTPILTGARPGKPTVRIALGSPDIPPECGYPLSSAQYEDPNIQLSD